MDKLFAFLSSFSGPGAYGAVFVVLLACGLGVPIPEDITLFAGGYMAYKGLASVYWMIAIAFAGVMVGDSIIFLLGRKFGMRLARKGFFRKVLPPERLERVSLMLKKRGYTLIFFARFMPGFRAPVYFSSGTLGLPFRVFFFFDGLAALISVPLLVYLVYTFGDRVDQIVEIIQKVEGGIAIAIFSVILLFIGKWYVKKKRARKSAPRAAVNSTPKP